MYVHTVYLQCQETISKYVPIKCIALLNKISLVC